MWVGLAAFIALSIVPFVKVTLFLKRTAHWSPPPPSLELTAAALSRCTVHLATPSTLIACLIACPHLHPCFCISIPDSLPPSLLL